MFGIGSFRSWNSILKLDSSKKSRQKSARSSPGRCWPHWVRVKQKFGSDGRWTDGEVGTSLMWIIKLLFGQYVNPKCALHRQGLLHPEWSFVYYTGIYLFPHGGMALSAPWHLAFHEKTGSGVHQWVPPAGCMGVSWQNCPLQFLNGTKRTTWPAIQL